VFQDVITNDAELVEIEGRDVVSLPDYRKLVNNKQALKDKAAFFITKQKSGQ